MPTPLPESGAIKHIVEILLKPFSALINPIAERIGEKLKRKPKVYFHIHPVTSVWCYAWNGYGEMRSRLCKFVSTLTSRTMDMKPF